MRKVGIIAEYNPFHSGHAGQIAALKRAGAETVCIAMGGDFTQRGTPALFSKQLRAEAALACGADLAAELPVQWAAAEADRFAEGGVFLLAAMGCDTIAFGSECGELAPLQTLANLFEEEDFNDELVNRHIIGGGSLAALRAQMAEKKLPGAAKILAGPNNSLGIAYLRAIRRLELEMDAVTLMREGAGHDAPLTESSASGLALRRLFYEQGAAALTPYVPEDALSLYINAEKDGAYADEEAFSRSLLTVLRTKSSEEFARLPGAGSEGLSHLLENAAAEAVSARDLYDRMKSKRYTHARLRRFALAAYLGLPQKAPELPPYLHLLGGDEKGLERVSGVTPLGQVPVSASLAKLEKQGGSIGETAALEIRAGVLWGTCCKAVQPVGHELTAKFIRK